MDCEIVKLSANVILIARLVGHGHVKLEDIEHGLRFSSPRSASLQKKKTSKYLRILGLVLLCDLGRHEQLLPLIGHALYNHSVSLPLHCKTYHKLASRVVVTDVDVVDKVGGCGRVADELRKKRRKDDY